MSESSDEGAQPGGIRRGWDHGRTRYRCVGRAVVLTTVPKRDGQSQNLSNSGPDQTAPSAIEYRTLQNKKRFVQLSVSGTKLSKDMTSVLSGAEKIRTFTFPSTTRSVQDLAFERRKLMRAVVLNEGLERIGGCKDGQQYIGAFYKTKLVHITLPSTLTVLGDNTFQWCEQLRSVIFAEGSKLEKIGRGCFFQAGLEEFRAPPGLRTIADGTFCYCWRLKRVVLNEGLEMLGGIGLRVTIGVFAGAQLDEIALPASLRTLGNCVFWKCKGLKRITLPEGSRLETLGEMCFAETGVREFLAPASLRQIKDGAFQNCSELTLVRLNEGL